MPKVAKKPVKKGKYYYPCSIQRLAELTPSPDRGQRGLPPSVDGMPTASLRFLVPVDEIISLINQQKNFED